MTLPLQQPDPNAWDVDEKTQRSISNIDALTSRLCAEIDQREETFTRLKELASRANVTVDELRDYLRQLEPVET